MKEERFYDDRINYQESCFIVNAMNYYASAFHENTQLSKEAKEYHNKIIDKYCKLEEQILNLRIKEGN